MSRISRLLVASGTAMIATLAVHTPARAALPSPLTCALTGGNNIRLTIQLTPQSQLSPDVFALAGQWDDASLSPLLPVYGAIVEDPNLDFVGGLTYVGFSGHPMPSAPFGTRPRGFQVQFRLRPGASVVPTFVGKWADNHGGHGNMSCVVGS